MNADLWVTLISAVLGSGALTAVITAAITAHSERKKAAAQVSAAEARVASAERQALMMLTLDSLQARCRAIIATGSRTQTDTQQIIIQHDVYKALKGHGWADALFTSAMELPLV